MHAWASLKLHFRDRDEAQTEVNDPILKHCTCAVYARRQGGVPLQFLHALLCVAMCGLLCLEHLRRIFLLQVTRLLHACGCAGAADACMWLCRCCCCCCADAVECVQQPCCWAAARQAVASAACGCPAAIVVWLSVYSAFYRQQQQRNGVPGEAAAAASFILFRRLHA